MSFCFQWRAMQEKIQNGDSYKQKCCYFGNTFCINSLEERHWLALELGMEKQTNQVREKGNKVFEKGFSNACIAKLAATSGSSLEITGHCTQHSQQPRDSRALWKPECGLHITWVPLQCQRQKNKERGENKKKSESRVCHCVSSLSTNWGKLTASFN